MQILELQREKTLLTKERDDYQSNFDNLRDAYTESIHKRDLLVDENLAIKGACDDLSHQLNAIRGVRTDGQDPNTQEGRINESIIESLRVKTEAYERQNMFLNNEIVQLAIQRQYDGDALGALTLQKNAVEKQHEDLRVQHLELLKMATDEGSFSRERVREMVAKALQDNQEGGSVSSMRQDTSECDRYGFRIKADIDSALHALTSTIPPVDENVIKAKWEQYFDARGDREFSRDVKDYLPPDTLKNLVRGGIYHGFRKELWAEMIRDWTKAQQRFQGKNYFHRILEHKEQKMSTATKQIELDLARTFPTHKDFCDLECEGIAKLRRVLVAFSWHNPVIGYCQGMNMMAALLLLILDEEMAFWGLIAVVEHILPKAYYGSGMLGVSRHQLLFSVVFSSLFLISTFLFFHSDPTRHSLISVSSAVCCWYRFILGGRRVERSSLLMLTPFLSISSP